MITSLLIRRRLVEFIVVLKQVSDKFSDYLSLEINDLKTNRRDLSKTVGYIFSHHHFLIYTDD